VSRSAKRCPQTSAACGALSCAGSSRSVPRQKSSETSVPASVVTQYSMTRTLIPGMEDVPSSVELRWRPDDHQATFTFSS